MIFMHERYQDWLHAELQARRKMNSRYSLSSFAKRLEMSQPLLSLILQGKRRLTKATAGKISRRLKLSRLEREYLLSLIEFETDLESGKQVRQEIRTRGRISELSLKLFHAMSDWHFSALMELVRLDGIVHDPAVFARRLGISKAEVIKALASLVELKILEKRNGKYIRVDSGFSSTPHDISDEALRLFHKQILRKASAALDSQSVSQRQISGYTLAIDPEKLPKAKEMIKEFSEKLGTFLEGGCKEKVYQLSISLFSLEAISEEKE